MMNTSRPHFDHRADGFTKPIAEALVQLLAEQLPPPYQVELGAEPYRGCYPVRVVDPRPLVGRDWHLYTERHVLRWLDAVGVDPAPAAALLASSAEQPDERAERR
jgi:hypothetical protein